MTSQQLVAGFRVDAQPAKVSSASKKFYAGNYPATVHLRHYGEDGHQLTPDEARLLAAILIAAASVAEGKDKP